MDAEGNAINWGCRAQLHIHDRSHRGVHCRKCGVFRRIWELAMLGWWSCVDLTARYDGTWMTRGHKSQYMIGCIMIDVMTGLVIDLQVVSLWVQCWRWDNHQEPLWRDGRAYRLPSSETTIRNLCDVMDVPTGDHLLRQPSGTSVTWWTCLQATIFWDNHQEPLWRDGRAYRRPSSETTIRNLCDVMDVPTGDHLLRQRSGTSVTWWTCLQATIFLDNHQEPLWRDGRAYRRPSSETTIRNLCDVMDVPIGDHLLRQRSGTSVTWWTCLQATIFLDNHQEPLWRHGRAYRRPSSETTIRNLCDVMDVPTGDHLLRQPSGTSVTSWTCLQATIFWDNDQEPLWRDGRAYRRPSSETTIRNLCDVMDVHTGDHLLRQPSGTSVMWWTCLQATIFWDNHQEPLWRDGRAYRRPSS